MIISGSPRVSELYRPAAAGVSTRTQKTEGKRDEVALSVKAKDYQTAKTALAKVPDVREDLVRDIAARFANGTYNVTAKDVAEKLFDQLV